MKQCKRCNETKNEAHFTRVSKNGRIYIRHTCRRCYSLDRKPYPKEPERLKSYQQRPDYKLYHKHLTRLRRSIMKIRDNKALNTYEVLLKERFESMFLPHMNWENYSIAWQPDHITPLLRLIRQGLSNNELMDLNNLRPLDIDMNMQRLRKPVDEYKINYF